MASLTSDELNYVILRYLLESGFVHSAFAFSHESSVTKANIASTDVVPGALISFVQKGLQYAQIEAHVAEDGTEVECDGEFSLVTPHQCNISSRKRMFDPSEPVDADYGTLDTDPAERLKLSGHSAMVCVTAWNPVRPILATGSADGTVRLWDLSAEARGLNKKRSAISSIAAGEAELARQMRDIVASVIVLDPLSPTGSGVIEVDEANANDEEGPGGSFHIPALVTGSMAAVSTTNSKKRRKGRSDEESSPAQTQPLAAAAVAASAVGLPRNRAVVSVDWSPRGTRLALGSYDGRVSIYAVPPVGSTPPSLLYNCTPPVGSASAARTSGINLSASSMFQAHEGPVSAVKFSRGRGDLLLSGGVDGTVCVWDVGTGALRHFYAPPAATLSAGPQHVATSSMTSSAVGNLRSIWPAAPILDADWKDDHIFAIACASVSPQAAELALSSTTVGHASSLPSLTAPPPVIISGADLPASNGDPSAFRPGQSSLAAPASTAIPPFGNSSIANSSHSSGSTPAPLISGAAASFVVNGVNSPSAPNGGSTNPFPLSVSGPRAVGASASGTTVGLGGSSLTSSVAEEARTGDADQKASGSHGFGRVLIFDVRKAPVPALAAGPAITALLAPAPSTPVVPPAPPSSFVSPGIPVARVAACRSGDVNVLRWCPFGKLLATAGDDGVARVWRVVLDETSSGMNGIINGRDGDSAATSIGGSGSRGGNLQSSAHERDAEAQSAMADQDIDSAAKKSPNGKSGEKLRTEGEASALGIQEISRPYLVLSGHERAISCLRFNVDPAVYAASSTASGSNEALPSDFPIYLATGSADCTAKVWELSRGRCIMTLAQHIHPVNGLAWSQPSAATLSEAISAANAKGSSTPSTSPYMAGAPPLAPGGVVTRQLLATFSHERVHIWATSDGSLAKTFRADAAAGDVAWGGGSHLAVGAADGSVYVVDAHF